MIEAIKQFFAQHLDTDGAGETDLERRVRLAAAALLIETARADHSEDAAELDTLRRAVQRTFSLDDQQTRELIEVAGQRASDSTSHYQFTSLIKDHFSPEQKTHLIELMWQVAFADRSLDKYEEHLVRKIAELLYVPHRDFIAAKHRAMEKAGLA